MGFTNIVTIDEVKKAFPLLDIVDHSNRTWIAKNGITRSHSQDDFEPIEGMLRCLPIKQGKFKTWLLKCTCIKVCHKNIYDVDVVI